MALTTTALANKFPAFGIDVTITGHSDWIVTDLQIATSGPVVELQDANGMTVARTYYNNNAAGQSYDRTLTMTVVVVGSSSSAAGTANVCIDRGTVLVVSACATHPDAVGSWEIVSTDQTGSNTAYATMTVVGKQACSVA